MKSINYLQGDSESSTVRPVKPLGGVLQDWTFHQYPAFGIAVLTGRSQRDLLGRFRPGVPIHTSRLVGFDLQQMIVETLNSRYKLTGLRKWRQYHGDYFPFAAAVIKHIKEMNRITH